MKNDAPERTHEKKFTPQVINE